MISPEGRIPSWSFNRLDTHTACAYRALLRYGKKAEVPKAATTAPAALRGKDHHKYLEQFVRGEIEEADLPKELLKHIDKFDWRQAREGYANNPASFILEEEWAWDADWQPCAWMAPNVWGRAKVDRAEWLDAEHTALEAIDYKTGKKFGNEVKHSMQMQCYAAISFMRFPSLETFKTRLQYTDEGRETIRSYTREQAQHFVKMFTTRAKAMTDATHFRPRPSAINCAYCEYGPNNGGSGICDYGVETKK